MDVYVCNMMLCIIHVEHKRHDLAGVFGFCTLREGAFMLTLIITLISMVLGVITKNLVDHLMQSKIKHAKKRRGLLHLIVGSLGTVCCVIVKMIGAVVAFVL